MLTFIIAESIPRREDALQKVILELLHMFMYFFREHYHSRMIREFLIYCDLTDVTLVGDGVTKASGIHVEPLEIYGDMY